MNNPYNVLFIYFNNLERTRAVFEQIRKARPAVLFLYQDGARAGKGEEKKALEVREFVENNIDWECIVHKKYQPTNVGCDPSEYLAQTWAFSIVDKCIVLEDDDVPNLSFFRFCWELLLKYEHDSRIGIICGMNNLTTYGPNNADYFFTRSGSIWGWATWKRVIDNWDKDYSWLDDERSLKIVEEWYKNKKAYQNFVRLAERRRESKIEYYETILGVSLILNHQLNIVPCKNMISNIGVNGGVHTSGSFKAMLKKRQRLFFKETYELDGQLRHPTEVAEDARYKMLVDRDLRLNFAEKCICKIKKAIYR